MDSFNKFSMVDKQVLEFDVNVQRTFDFLFDLESEPATRALETLFIVTENMGCGRPREYEESEGNQKTCKHWEIRL